MAARGVFVTFEGPEGSGKTTQLRLLAERLRKTGRDVVETQEPGGTPIGVQIRHVLLDAKNRELCPTAELLLMFASRAQNEQETQPASPMNLARTLRTERSGPAHCVTPRSGPMSKARGSVRLIN